VRLLRRAVEHSLGVEPGRDRANGLDEGVEKPALSDQLPAEPGLLSR
jgi:hypothetical protein